MLFIQLIHFFLVCKILSVFILSVFQIIYISMLNRKNKNFNIVFAIDKIINFILNFLSVENDYGYLYEFKIAFICKVLCK